MKGFKLMRLNYIIREQRASAFVLAMAFVLLSLWSVMVFETHLRSGLSAHEVSSTVQTTGVIQNGIGKSLVLLETGEPPDGYTCKIASATATPAIVALGFKKQSDLNWNVFASSEDLTVAQATCTCPSVFYSTSTDNLWTNCN